MSVSSPPARRSAVYCAIVNRAYFIGAVALVNSLRLRGHSGDIALLDTGLDEDQRAFLAQEATVHDGPPDAGWLSVLAKPSIARLYPDRSVVILDNDLVITGSLEPLVSAAEAGEITVFEQPDPTRWFAEWQELFSLRDPLRREPYVNSGCVALSTARWGSLLERWYEVGESIAPTRAARPFVLPQDEIGSDPVGYPDQDALNALLMSEVPESAIRRLPHHLAPFWEDRDRVRVVDSGSLRCAMDGQSVMFLHCTGQPKPWQPKGWLRLPFRAFNTMLTRALTGEDIPLRLAPEQVPSWLRQGVRGRSLALSGAAAARVAHGSMSILPDGLRTRLVSPIRARLSGTGARA